MRCIDNASTETIHQTVGCRRRRNSRRRNPGHRPTPGQRHRPDRPAGRASQHAGPPDCPDGEDPRIRVSWDGSDTGATGYTITRGDGQTFDADGTETTFSDHSVEPGTAYSYTVTANSGQGDSPASAAASASVADAPSAPGNLNAAVAESTAADETASVTLTWTASSVPPVEQCDVTYPLDGYTVSRSDGTDEIELGTTGAGATSFTDPNAGFSRNYTYRVAARNAIGTSPAAEAAATIPSRPILPPTGLTATITDPFDGNVSLAWMAPAAGPEVAGYLVLRYDGADPLAGNAIPTTLAESATETTLTDSTVNAGSTYSYVVIALSADNVSEPAHSAAIEPPAPPTGLAATAANGTIDLTWTAPDAGAIGAYRVERQPQGGQWAHLADATATSHNDDTAEDNATYAYRVQHRNDHGGSTWSDIRCGNARCRAQRPHQCLGNGLRQRQRPVLDGSRQPVHRRLPRAAPHGRRRLGQPGGQHRSRNGHPHPPGRRRRCNPSLRGARP